MAISRDPEAKKMALRDLLQYFRREPTSLYRIGPISLWLRGGYPIEQLEALFEGLVDAGIVRHATREELREYGYNHGYFLTPEGLEGLPPEDRSYGVI